MDGLLTVSRLVNDDNNYRLEKLVSRFKLHNRLVIAMTYLSVSADLGYVSSIGWDSKLVVSRIDLKDSIPKVAIVGQCKLLTKATCILSLIDDESGLPVFLTGRTDSSLLSMFTLFGEIGSETLVEVAKLSLNDAEFSSHSFYPMTMASVGNSRVSIGTNEVPFMRLITVEVPSIREAVKIPEGDLLDRLRRISDDHNDASIMRDRIVSNLDSFTPQDKYSSPIVLGRGRREGVWIMGDDGIVRGFDLKRGEVVEEMRSEGGRIKSGFVGDIGGDGPETDGTEVVVSCGIDGVAMWR
ncbi:DEKNAAC104226 [Brettanomyces naardenensis]|uniref:DEKNAAC104226 n=1 Tax=Brettanomyces naardenensis TaxID=13370 RepID=A0A448YQE7_BRENA|nr:DEKNAAC104226 [Brettanomyces naardenensis]